MKKFIIGFILSLFLINLANAGKVFDNAKLLSQPDINSLELSLVGVPIWIETQESVPNNDIKTFGSIELPQHKGCGFSRTSRYF
jgi:hypothetical protein